jgi:hypothetical protein
MHNFHGENLLEEEGRNVKMILIRVMELGCDNGRKISLAQDHVQWQTRLLHVNTDLVNMTFQLVINKIITVCLTFKVILT